jgi:hypothetical protein
MKKNTQNIATLTDDQILDLRLCDLPDQLMQSRMAPYILRLLDELQQKGFRHFAPHFWVSDEWFSPDGIPGVAVPFYLLHPRLMKIEKQMMLEIDGGNSESCMKVLRHETGHAIDNAYRIRRKRKRQQLFGLSTRKYPETYLPKPHSTSFVRHIQGWYAQAHPDEDFAETFAVWLTPGLDWETQYHNWPALRKLRYVDALMKELATQKPPIRSRAKPDSVSRNKMPLHDF